MVLRYCSVLHGSAYFCSILHPHCAKFVPGTLLRSRGGSVS